MRWPVGLVYLAVPIGMALMLAHLALIARRYVLRPRDEAERVRAAELGSAL
jgi:TRAP-type C4-dicarboxylate transport system permease small subunit